MENEHYENLLIQLSDHGSDDWVCDIRFMVELSDGGSHSVLVRTDQIYLDMHDWSDNKIRDHIHAHVEAKLMLSDLGEIRHTILMPESDKENSKKI
jgi:hypothetical protein